MRYWEIPLASVAAFQLRLICVAEIGFAASAVGAVGGVTSWSSSVMVKLIEAGEPRVAPVAPLITRLKLSLDSMAVSLAIVTVTFLSAPSPATQLRVVGDTDASLELAEP